MYCLSLLHWLRPTEQRAQKMQYRVGLLCALGFGFSTLWINIGIHPVHSLKAISQSIVLVSLKWNVDGLIMIYRPNEVDWQRYFPRIGYAGYQSGEWFCPVEYLSTVLIFVLVYVWGSALGGVGAGIFSVGILSMMAPMVLLPRFLTYYPPIVLVTVFAATGLALWGRFRTPVTAFICGI